MWSTISRRSFILGAVAAGVLQPRGSVFAEHDDELTNLSLRGVVRRLRQRRVTSQELTEACLRRIERYNPSLNAFITVTSDLALAAASRLDEEARRGQWRSSLHGVPIALKDNMDLAGVRTTAGSAVRRDSPVATEDAEVVRRLKAAGAVILGKTNMVEFAAGGPATASAFGPARNPWALDHTPGGSSSGAAVAVSARLCFAAVGTDTGGSIRGPAGICGISGLKTTYGRASTRGIIPYSWSLDTVGPLARSADDAAALLQTFAGYDPLDPACVNAPVPDFERQTRMTVRRLRVGVARTPFLEEMRPEYVPPIEAALETMHLMTAGVRDVQLPFVDPEVFVVVQRAEAYAYHRGNFDRTPELYQPYLRRSLNIAKTLGAADYAAARRDLDRWRRAIEATFEQVDVLVTPTSAVSDKIADIKPPDTYSSPTLRSRNSLIPMNAYGIPAISIPCGFTNSGLPVGVQIAGPMWGEGRVLALSHAYQARTTWHLAVPTFALTLG